MLPPPQLSPPTFLAYDRVIVEKRKGICSSFIRLALSMLEINENVFNIEIIRYLRKSYPAFKLFFIVSNHFFLHIESNY